MRVNTIYFGKSDNLAFGGVWMDKKSLINRLQNYKLTEFQKKVLEETLNIPKGDTRTYRQIAISIGHPNAYRAVGSALKINPLAPMIPCHRVIKSSGELGNYSALGGTAKKRRMLKAEKAI